LPLIIQIFIANLVQALDATNIQFLIHKKPGTQKSLTVDRTKNIYRKCEPGGGVVTE